MTIASSRLRSAALPLIFLAAGVAVSAQASTEPQEPVQPKGQVLFERHGDPALEPATDPAQKPSTSSAREPAPGTIPDVSDAERSALTFTAYDLDARLSPSTGHLAMRARITVRNDGDKPLKYVVLQVSSTLAWESVSLLGGNAPVQLPVVQHLLETDADHTGSAREAILTLPAPLAPGATLSLDTFYSGIIAQNANRLERIGAAHEEAISADWDAISEASTALRGFGNVLWYPVAAPQVFLGQGAQLFDAIGAMKLHDSTARVKLRLSVEAEGDAPIAAYFCGRRVAFKTVTDNPDLPIATAPGIATAEFSEVPVGFRTMSLFLINSPETLAAALPGGDASARMIAVVTANEAPLPLVTANAKDGATLLADWLGPKPLSALTILDHPGQPFEDGPLLIAPLSSLGAAEALPAITHSLTHAWIQTGQPWMDEGLAQFFVLIETERLKGREAAVTQLADLIQPVQLAEPALEAGKAALTGQPLSAATTDLYYRRKAAAVWWMLRDLAGDDALKLTLQGWRTRPTSNDTPAQQAVAFEQELEKNAHKDFGWFFEDWVLRDRGLPDLTLVDVTPRELPAAAGRSAGWLVSVTVRNEGAAVADVPLVIRSGSYSTTQRMRITGFSNATTRIVVEAPPTQVVLNDGTVPEQRNSLHTRDIVPHAAK